MEGLELTKRCAPSKTMSQMWISEWHQQNEALGDEEQHAVQTEKQHKKERQWRGFGHEALTALTREEK